MLAPPPPLFHLDIFCLGILNVYSVIHSAGIYEFLLCAEPVLGAVVTAGKKENQAKIRCHVEGEAINQLNV